MDNHSDPTIRFDELGQCNYCTHALEMKKKYYFPNSVGADKLASLLTEVKNSGLHRKYDCIMGLSGGLDSSYLVYLGHKWGLRVLAVHIDDGFDSEIASRNLQKLVNATGFDYLVVKPDSGQFAELTKAYLRAGLPNAAVPQDNVLFAFLYDCVKRNKIRFFFSGSNFALENILQRGGTYDNTDLRNLRDVHRAHGSGPIDRLKFISAARVLVLRVFYRLRIVQPLDFLDYNRDKALSELASFCEYEYYGAKHLENKLTEFIQLYWLPRKFGVDKRTSHLSSLIVSGQLTREAALAEYLKPAYRDHDMDECLELVKAKLMLTDEEFDGLMSADVRAHTDFRTSRFNRALRAARKLRTMAIFSK